MKTGLAAIVLAVFVATTQAQSIDVPLIDVPYNTAHGLRARVTDLNPQLARFTFSKPELFHFHNADGDRLGALLYKPANRPPSDKVPVITWVYEKMTPAIHRFNARDQLFISHGYAMLMPNVKVRVGQTADSFEKCVVPAVNASRFCWRVKMVVPASYVL